MSVGMVWKFSGILSFRGGYRIQKIAHETIVQGQLRFCPNFLPNSTGFETIHDGFCGKANVQCHPRDEPHNAKA